MPNEVTVVIPIGPSHVTLSEQAIASVHAQTIPVGVIAVEDKERRGAGHTRNVGLAQVSTPFTIFLDADDLLEPSFCETTLQAWEPGKYIYTDWFEGRATVPAPECAWDKGRVHLVTTLLPTAAVRAIGGFDGSLPGAEDTAFYLRLLASGVCGKHVAQPLVHYTGNGQRSEAFEANPEKTAYLARFYAQYGSTLMACCGQNATQDGAPVGARREGDVLARATWGGNRKTVGLGTGRVYPRTGDGALCWVDPKDVEFSRGAWTLVQPRPAPMGVPTPASAPKAAFAEMVQPSAPIIVAPPADKADTVRRAQTRILQAEPPAAPPVAPVVPPVQPIVQPPTLPRRGKPGRKPKGA